MLAVDGGDDAIELIDAVDALLGHDGVHDRGWIGETGGFEDDALDRWDVAPQGAGVHAFESLDEVAADLAAHTSRRQQDGVVVDLLNEAVVDADLAELVDDDAGAGHGGIVEEALQERGLTGAEKAREHGQRDGLRCGLAGGSACLACRITHRALLDLRYGTGYTASPGEASRIVIARSRLIRRDAMGKRATARGGAKGSAASDVRAAQREVLETALAMSRQGLSPGRSGNVSRRFGSGMVITPSGMAYDAITPDDVVIVDCDGTVATGQRKPSSEWRFHLDSYRARTDIGGVVHTHSLHATVLACAHKAIPAFHYMVAVAGGRSIPVVPYATFGTEALSRHVVKGLETVNACLMANHGQIAVGGTCAAALELAGEVEVLAEQYVKVLAIGGAKLIDDGEMDRVIALFKGYGQRAQDS